MQEYFTNQKLEFAEELVLYTDSHIFLTGRAGTGKTTFLRNLRAKTYKRMVVVAPTGVAAINAGGQTIHSFFQLPFGPQIPEDGIPLTKASQPTEEEGLFAGNESSKPNARTLASQYQKLRKSKLNIIRSLDLLVIDEISMVRADVLDAIDAVLRRARRSQKPFGGVQLLMIGDVHQLAPVAKPDEWEILAPYYNNVYFFGSHVLQKTPYLCVELDHVYRQHDEDFITLLNKVRDNRMDAECLQLLNQRYLPDFSPKDNEGYITLTTHNHQADEINESKLEALPSQSVFFDADIKGTFPENTFPTKEELELKIGAQVMFVKNDPSPEKAFFNGKIGRVVGIDEDQGTVEVQCGDEILTVSKLTWQNMEYSINAENQNIEENEIGSFTQIPLRLAWAVTIHKSQGLTFDKLIIDAGQAFAHGQVYVALSRCTSLDGLVLKTRIPSSALVNDFSVNQFVDHIPELEPTQEKVDQLRHDYELEVMLELIDFYGLYKGFGKVMKILYDNNTLFDADMIQDLSKRRNQFPETLCGVGSKFEGQVRKLHAQAPSCEENTLLQERLTKGAVYFKEQLDKLTEGFFELPFKTDNKAINELLTETLGQFKEDLQTKQSCLETCCKCFSIKEYQRAKAVAVLEAEKKPKAKVSIKDDLKGNSLYKRLHAWRAERADELDVEVYRIVPTTALKTIAKEQPVTLRELKAIKGMGDKRVKQFGAEILDIILRSLGQQGINLGTLEDTSDEPQKESKKESPKEPKISTYEITKNMIEEGLSPEQIAKERGLKISTIYGHLARFIEKDLYDATQFVSEEHYDTIRDYFESTEDPSLGAAKDVLGDEFDFGEIRMVLTELKRDGLFVTPLPSPDELPSPTDPDMM
ncbi:MAG: helix-turn-helix domain-containing protein [Bacteroidales bacterium]|nr:helix-turn-helix domain-containing protein [Bacteroidales bacterium]